MEITCRIDIPETVIVELVVGGEGDESTPARPQREEDLHGGISPYLQESSLSASLSPSSHLHFNNMLAIEKCYIDLNTLTSTLSSSSLIYHYYHDHQLNSALYKPSRKSSYRPKYVDLYIYIIIIINSSQSPPSPLHYHVS